MREDKRIAVTRQPSNRIVYSEKQWLPSPPHPKKKLEKKKKKKQTKKKNLHRMVLETSKKSPHQYSFFFPVIIFRTSFFSFSF